MSGWHLDHIFTEIVKLVFITLLVIVISYDNNGTISCLHLFDVGLDVVKSRIRARSDKHNRHELIDECDGSMLHFSSGVALCMNVRHFLALHCALKGDGEIEA